VPLRAGMAPSSSMKHVPSASYAPIDCQVMNLAQEIVVPEKVSHGGFVVAGVGRNGG
jgi:hypothetical protein